MDDHAAARWGHETVGPLDDHTVNLLFGVTARTWQRWRAGHAVPTGIAGMRLQTVTTALEHLCRAYTAAGAVGWFEREHPQLDGQQPADLLADPGRHRQIIDAASSALESDAT